MYSKPMYSKPRNIVPEFLIGLAIVLAIATALFIGYQLGYSDGNHSGYQAGYQTGHQDGYTQGYSDGTQHPAQWIYQNCQSYPFLLLNPNEYMACHRP